MGQERGRSRFLEESGPFGTSARIGDCRTPDRGRAALAVRSALAASGVWTLAFLLLAVAPTRAQEAPSTPPGQAPSFLADYNFHIDVEALSSADPRFSWDASVGGDIDVIDFGVGRVNLLANYEVVMGDELRPFDTNQGNYTLEASVALRVRGTEFSGVFHHVSRHLADRPKPASVAWNVLGVRMQRRFVTGSIAADVGSSIGAIVQHASVDYAWTGDLRARIAHRLAPSFQLFGGGSVDWFGIDEARSARDTQWSGRIEVGVRIGGRAGDVEVFVGYARRADAYPTESAARRWPLAGFRIVGG